MLPVQFVPQSYPGTFTGKSSPSPSHFGVWPGRSSNSVNDAGQAEALQVQTVNNLFNSVTQDLQTGNFEFLKLIDENNALIELGSERKTFHITKDEGGYYDVKSFNFMEIPSSTNTPISQGKVQKLRNLLSFKRSTSPASFSYFYRPAETGVWFAGKLPQSSGKVSLPIDTSLLFGNTPDGRGLLPSYFQVSCQRPGEEPIDLINTGFKVKPAAIALFDALNQYVFTEERLSAYRKAQQDKTAG